MQENYKILGLDQYASNEEIEEAYLRLKEKYQRERFYEGEIGNDAAKKLTKLENAYREIKAERFTAENTDNSGAFVHIEELIKAGRISDAQSKLDEFSDRNAEWHYLQAVIFYKKNWHNESKKQLEIALSMDSDNPKYSQAYQKLKQKMAYTEHYFNDRQENVNQQNRQMGGSSNDCMTFCLTWCCMDMMCSMCCR